MQVDGSAAYHLAMCDDIGNAAYDTQGARVPRPGTPALWGDNQRSARATAPARRVLRAQPTHCSHSARTCLASCRVAAGVAAALFERLVDVAAARHTHTHTHMHTHTHTHMHMHMHMHM